MVKINIDMTNKTKLVYGVGVNDLNIKENKDSYVKWTSMLQRCYSDKFQIRHETYIGCKVCNEWHIFSKFNEWYIQNNKIGFVLDKDIIVRDNKIYSPGSCRFVPNPINLLLTSSLKRRGKYKQGVTFDNTLSKFRSVISRGSGSEHIGYFETEDEAFEAYKNEKEKYIKTQADYYFNLGLIDLDIHTALYNWVIIG